MNKKKMKTTFGIGGILQGLSPLLSLIPGGQIAAPIASLAGGLIDSREQKSINPNIVQPQNNINPYGLAMGGQLNPVSPNTVEVQGNNPQATDGVELSNAYVDHGETISGTSKGEYVFSDKLFDPLSGKTFAELDKKIASSDKKASDKPYDKEAQNTLKYNQKLRERTMMMNEAVIAVVRETQPSAPQNKEGYQAGGFPGTLDPNLGFNLNQIVGMLNNTPMEPNALTPKLWDRTAHQSAFSIGTPDRLPDFPTNARTLTSPVIGGSASREVNGMPIVQQNQGINYLPNMRPLQPITPQTNYAADRVNQIISQPSNVSGVDGVPGPIDESTNKFSLKDNLGTMLQVGELLGKGATLLRRPQEEQLYRNTAPINLQQYNPDPALLRGEYAFNAQMQDINNSVGQGFAQAQKQQAYANKYANDARVIQQYQDMNTQAANQYEARLAQRQGENIQYAMNRDNMNAQNTGAYFNALRGFMGDIGNTGRGINQNKSNQQAVQWLLEAYPDIKQYYDDILKKKNTKTKEE